MVMAMVRVQCRLLDKTAEHQTEQSMSVDFDFKESVIKNFGVNQLQFSRNSKTQNLNETFEYNLYSLPKLIGEIHPLH